MLVCFCILVRLAACDQTDHGPGRGKINLVGEREPNVENVQQRGGRWDRRTAKPFTPCSSSRTYVPVRTGPACCSNSNSSHSQTEINRILRYTELSIKIFAQMIAALRGKLKGASTGRNLPNEAEITGLECAERRH